MEPTQKSEVGNSRVRRRRRSAFSGATLESWLRLRSKCFLWQRGNKQAHFYSRSCSVAVVCIPLSSLHPPCGAFKANRGRKHIEPSASGGRGRSFLNRPKSKASRRPSGRRWWPAARDEPPPLKLTNSLTLTRSKKPTRLDYSSQRKNELKGSECK